MGWNLHDFLKSLESFGENLLEEAGKVTAFKEIFHEEFIQLIDELKGAIGDANEFADRAKHLKTKLVRADIAFELINDIRTGKLFKFIHEEMEKLRSVFLESAEEFLTSIQKVKTSEAVTQVGKFKDILDFVRKVRAIYGKLAILVHTLRNLVPIVKEIREKLMHYEDIILPQNTDRHYIGVAYQVRTRSSGVVRRSKQNLEADKRGTQATLNLLRSQLKKLQ